jgi:hypothetical protein
VAAAPDDCGESATAIYRLADHVTALESADLYCSPGWVGECACDAEVGVLRWLADRVAAKATQFIRRGQRLVF